MNRPALPGLPTGVWPRAGTPPTAWLETLVISALLPTLGLLVNSEDPFFLTQNVTWLSFAPLMAALRYGFAHGFVSALLLIGGIVVHWHWREVPPTAVFPTSTALALAVTGMLAGAWADWWARRLAQLKVENAYHRQRLGEFTTAYHLLRISHDRLSHRVAASTDSLRDTLQRLHGYLQHSQQANAPLRGMAGDILALFGNFTWVQVAALYAVDERGALLRPAEAELGEPAPVDEGNPLVAAALRKRELVAASSADNRARTGGLLACAPILDGQRRCLALLVVERMPFMNFTSENLRLLAVLAAHVGHLLERAEVGSLGGSAEFARALQRALDDLRDFALPSTLAVLRCPAGKPGLELADFALAHSRGLDRPWQTVNRRDETLLFLLMPLTSGEEAERFLERLEAALGKRRNVASLAELARRGGGETLDALGMRSSLRPLNRDDSVASLFEQLAAEHHFDPGHSADTGRALR